MVDFLGEQQSIGADDREFTARDDAFDDLRQILVQKRLAAGDHHHRRATFVHRAQRVLDRKPLVEDMIGVIDLAAAGAGQIAAEQRLHHEHERITSHAQEVLLDEIRADFCDIAERNGHG